MLFSAFVSFSKRDQQQSEELRKKGSSSKNLFHPLDWISIWYLHHICFSPAGSHTYCQISILLMKFKCNYIFNKNKLFIYSLMLVRLQWNFPHTKTAWYMCKISLYSDQFSLNHGNVNFNWIGNFIKYCSMANRSEEIIYNYWLKVEVYRLWENLETSVFSTRNKMYQSCR